MSRLNKYFLRKMSKVSYISIITIVIILLLFIASFILYTKTTTKSIAALFGRIPLYYRLSSPEVNIVQAIRYIIILLYPFAIYKNKTIGY
jgi:uncharacterized membrane protein AbrB (regulator of aidB expression)